MTTQQVARTELIAALKERAAWDKSMGREEGPALMLQAAALLQADAEVGGEAFGVIDKNANVWVFEGKTLPPDGSKLYTRHQQAAQVPLTEQELARAMVFVESLKYVPLHRVAEVVLGVARAVEAAHRITGKAVA